MTELESFIRDVGERVSRRGEDERDWFAEWCAEFDAAREEADEDACTLLVDILVAFDNWQRYGGVGVAGQADDRWL